MGESFFTSGNQIITTEIDVDSPVTEGLVSKFKGRDVELSDTIDGLGGTGADGDVTITSNTSLYGIKHYNNLTINAGVTVTVEKVTAGAGTVSTDSYGVSCTFSTAHGLRVGDRVRLTSGPQANETRVVTRVDSTTTVTLRKGFSAQQTNQTWNRVETGIPLIIFARGTVTINGTIDGNAIGGIGGENTDVTTDISNVGESTFGGGAGGSGGGWDITGGGAGGDTRNCGIVSKGGVTGYTSAENGQDAPLSRLWNIPTDMKVGGGGGGGGKSGGTAGGQDGGDGGGCVYIEVPTIIINSGGIIRCNGDAGGNATSTYGSGGGGGGGVIVLRYKSLTNNGSLLVTGGAGGTGGSGNGGIGGAGVIYQEVIP